MSTSGALTAHIFWFDSTKRTGFRLTSTCIYENASSPPQMYTPTAKRRRIDNSSALHKPFQPPFRTPLKQNPNPSSIPSPRTTPLPATKASPAAAYRLKPPNDHSARAPTPHKAHTITSLAAHTRPHLFSPPTPLARHHLSLASTPRPRGTPSAAVLSSESATLRADINTLTQAIALLSSPADRELDALAAKWRGVAQAAAEELFATSRDRVNRMGGVGAWREREREQREWRRRWDREEAMAGQGGGRAGGEEREGFEDAWDGGGEGEGDSGGAGEEEPRGSDDDVSAKRGEVVGLY